MAVSPVPGWLPLVLQVAGDVLKLIAYLLRR